MISSIIYETMDFIYTLGRFAGRIVKGALSWYSAPVQKNRLDCIDLRIIELEEQRATIK